MRNRYELCIDIEECSSKPINGSYQCQQISKRIGRNRRTVSLGELANCLEQGQTWCTSVFVYGYRLAEQFESCQLVAVDIDYGDLSHEELVAKYTELELVPNIMHESFSSKQGARKWRLIYALDEPLSNCNDALRMSRYFAYLFDGDTSLVDTARMLYGTNKPVSLLHDEQQSVDKLLDEAISNNIPAKLEHKKPIACEQELLDMCSNAETDYQQQVALGFLHKGTRKLVTMVLTDVKELIEDPHGSEYQSRYRALFMASMKLAQIPAISHHSIKRWLLAGLEGKEVWSSWDKDPEHSINAGIEWGRRHLRTVFLPNILD